MKKIYPFLFSGALAIATTAAIGQTTMQRVSVAEQVTSASCGPCASQNPAFNQLLGGNIGAVVPVKYQRGGGNYIDPMWDLNPTEVDSRITGFYGVSSFPHVWIDGQDESVPATITQGTLDTYNATPATYHLEVDAQLINNNTELDVTVTATALQDFQAGANIQDRIYIAVIENDVNYATPPGLNGETDFYHVMRKMLPNQTGTTIGKKFTGETASVNYTYTIDLAENDPSDLVAVAWVQNSINRTVYQAHSSNIPPSSNPLLSVNENEVFADVNIYPTVTNSNVNIALTLASEANVSIEIIDAVGKQVFSEANMAFGNGYQVKNIDVSSYSNGLYFAAIRSGNQVITKKFIVSK
jgi:hypothetical protein